MGKTIVVPLDGSELAERALPYASELARRTHGRLVILHARPALAPPSDWPFDPASAAERMRAENVEAAPCVYLIYGDEIAAAICETASKQEADLIVMSTHGRGGISRLLFGSVADQVIRQAEVPVLLVPAGCERRWPTERALRILVPLDGSTLAKAVLDPVGALAKQVGAELLLLRIVDEFDHPLIPGEPIYVALRPGTELEPARAYLQQMADRLRSHAKSVDFLAVDGQPVPMIVQIAQEQQVDLIALATHGRSGVARFVLGSTTSGTLQRTEVPLLLVRPDGVRPVAELVDTEPAEAGPNLGLTAEATTVVGEPS